MLGSIAPLGISWSLKAILMGLIELLLSGCMVAAMSGQVARGHEFTPEQIEAYRKVGVRVYGCVTIGGPPPAGNAVFLLVPDGAIYNPIWEDGCRIHP